LFDELIPKVDALLMASKEIWLYTYINTYVRTFYHTVEDRQTDRQTDIHTKQVKFYSIT